MNIIKESTEWNENNVLVDGKLKSSLLHSVR